MDAWKNRRRKVSLAGTVTDIAGLVAAKTQGPGFGDAFSDMKVVQLAVNQEFVELDARSAALTRLPSSAVTGG